MFTILPDITVWSLSVPAGLILMILLACTGLPFMALAGQSLALSKRRSFYDKCAKQMANLAAILTPIALVLMGAIIARVLQMDPTLMDAPIALPLVGLMALMLSASLFAILYTLTWKSLANARLIQQLLGIISAMGMLQTIYVAFSIIRISFGGAQPLPATGSPFEIIVALLTPETPTLMWPALGLAFFAGLGITGSIAMAWLIMRRHSDDFGRDYYNFSMAWCARWLTCGAVLSLVPLAYLLAFMFGPLFTSLGATVQSVVATIPLVPMIFVIIAPITSLVCGFMASRSTAPMRFKPFVFANLFLQWFAIAGLISLLMTFARSIV